jgi:two-component system, chemotaxis family, response regulator WspF
LRVAIVNDSETALEAMRRVIAARGEHSVAWVARDGEEALRKCKVDRPDVVLMDLLMPVLDGVEATRRIMSESPCAILVVTATVSGNMTKVYEAMGHGALDAVNTPILGKKGEGGDDLLRKLGTVSKLIGASPRPPPTDMAAPSQAPQKAALPPLVAIGASTGGPQALCQILSQLPRGFAAGVIIVQHVDVEFAAGLATWLSDQSGFPVELAMAGARVEPGRALIAGTSDHLVMSSKRKLGYQREPVDNPYRPSVDAFFNSLVQNWPAMSVAALLTGMGRDGAEGLLNLRRAGWVTLAQDEATSVVFGMPKAAAEYGAASRVLPISRIAPAIVEAIIGNKEPK